MLFLFFKVKCIYYTEFRDMRMKIINLLNKLFQWCLVTLIKIGFRKSIMSAGLSISLGTSAGGCNPCIERVIIWEYKRLLNHGEIR